MNDDIDSLRSSTWWAPYEIRFARGPRSFRLFGNTKGRDSQDIFVAIRRRGHRR